MLSYGLHTEIILNGIVPLCDIPELNAFRACGKSWQLSIDQHVVWQKIAENIGAPWIENATLNRYYEQVKNYFYAFKNSSYVNQRECEPFFRSPTIQGFRSMVQLDRDLHIADVTFEIWKMILPAVEEDCELDPLDASEIGLTAYIDESSKFSEWIDEALHGRVFGGFGLHFYKIKFLPPVISKIALQKLSLSRNLLSTLPDELGCSSSLQNLNLNENEFSLFPPCVLRLTSLKVLNLFSNSLTAIPNEISCLRDLTKLNISENNLTRFPEGVVHLACLKKLDLSYNNITNLPLEIKNLVSLICFKINHNELTEVPSELAQLLFLDELYLHQNKIAALPEVFAVLSSSLRVYRMEGNPIQPMDLPTWIFDSEEFVDSIEVENEEEINEHKEAVSFKRNRSSDSETETEKTLAKKIRKQ